MMKTNELEQLSITLESILDQGQIMYGQAVSICSVFVESGFQRASFEDVVDSLFNRFEGCVPRGNIESNAADAIEFGITIGLFEVFDQDTITLSEQGLEVGTDWLNRLEQAA